ncbi:excinuclease ABC subunit B [candidate division CPR3 bacterium GWF2_35_18]|uniref:UvrABC system protein B n=1 Tax=candidate division CPR3 bacterium GW2011_GWF2_35_18 TaxID=1618350 RepID=A0A0G0C254_UNCC3|nr:MAG: UvrABC system protein B [candidate division CPR3 bacterium GW2011_GWF2_35_18]OGB63361.1 MAG: excinuclease ABC subunit B [candidate division CPR3 bacterium GWF2_35_18]OGB65571.1 MAG: excinuclease ABC subunit B [candidate division CPR3 bacterium RIFOXYA2_FULL_35_13]OGB79349.1 MAG: excinuclease ABC subunit B [candidate division CPR3 bacterium RIFOXYB2_FULL_35_8]
MKFKLQSQFKPTGDQPQAIDNLIYGLDNGVKDQVLLGVTGSGKTFTMANVIAKTQRPTLVISHNKTLAAQLAQEFKEFFPDNAVEYFVSYYDYYQPEAYIPQTDTYIDKESDINDMIEKLRLSTTASLLTRKDVIVVASVSCIYNIGSPIEFGKSIITLKIGKHYPQKKLITELLKLYYERNDFDFRRSTFRIRGGSFDIYPSWEDSPTRVEFTENEIIKQIYAFDPINGKKKFEYPIFQVFSARHYIAGEDNREKILQEIESDMEKEVKLFLSHGHHLEAERLKQRVKYDLEMIRELGFCSGIENYSRYFDGRKINDPPYTLLDYFRLFDSKLKNKQQPENNNWLLMIDESHMTVPQIGGMYAGDRSRKQTLIDYGFRLKAAFDNRPLNFDEFQARMPQTVYVSATPSEWELTRSKAQKFKFKKTWSPITQQLIRPTGLIDPEISIRPTEGQIPDLLKEINKRIDKGQRVLITTLTKKMSEDLSTYLKEKKIKSMYLHSDVDTLERTDILADLRNGKYDVLVGINLLREGLDLPEVSLVAILDADKESFLRSATSLIQTMGRAARHENGYVIMYADNMTKSMKAAINEVNRRRLIQNRYNKEHHIVPKSIKKQIRPKLIELTEEIAEDLKRKSQLSKKEIYIDISDLIEIEESWPEMLPDQKKQALNRLQRLMRNSAKNLDFERAAQIRDVIKKLSV